MYFYDFGTYLYENQLISRVYQNSHSLVQARSYHESNPRGDKIGNQKVDNLSTFFFSFLRKYYSLHVEASGKVTLKLVEASPSEESGVRECKGREKSSKGKFKNHLISANKSLRLIAVSVTRQNKHKLFN